MWTKLTSSDTSFKIARTKIKKSNEKSICMNNRTGKVRKHVEECEIYNLTWCRSCKDWKECEERNVS